MLHVFLHHNLDCYQAPAEFADEQGSKSGVEDRHLTTVLDYWICAHKVLYVVCDMMDIVIQKT